MISKARTWIGLGGGGGANGGARTKNLHSLDNLKYLFTVLNKNQTVTEHNKDLLIETLRSISEILIWGDQNDSSVFDFFLEKQMITFFLHYMKQRYGRFICVQLLQTLNILFENIRNETSLYFLFSNNHINNIILHKFDFSDEEVMAYYISFLKTLSLKLNTHSIHFFFNDRVAEFPLYVEALKLFDHPESMVRIAVRTLTLNVFKVNVPSMQRFVINKTAFFYFSNMVWLIRNHILDLDICVKCTTDCTKKGRLIDLIDEHIDHLNYLQDIFMLDNPGLSNCLSEQLIRRLIVPVYLSSLVRDEQKPLVKDRKPYVQPKVAIFLLSHLFAAIHHAPLLSDVCELIFYVNGHKLIDDMCFRKAKSIYQPSLEIDYLMEPKSLLQCLPMAPPPAAPHQQQQQQQHQRQEIGSVVHYSSKVKSEPAPCKRRTYSASNIISTTSTTTATSSTLAVGGGGDNNNIDAVDRINGFASSSILPVNDTAFSCNEATFTSYVNSVHNNNNNDTDGQSVGDESNTTPLHPVKLLQIKYFGDEDDNQRRQENANSENEANSKSSYIGIILSALLNQISGEVNYSELESLLTISFMLTFVKNKRVPSKYQQSLANLTTPSEYSTLLVNQLIALIGKAVEPNFQVRLVTVELAIKLLKSMSLNTDDVSPATQQSQPSQTPTATPSTTTTTTTSTQLLLNSAQMANIERAKEQAAFNLRHKFKNDELFLDMFEYEYLLLSSQELSFETLLRDWSILLAATSAALSSSGIEFTRRHPSDELEKLKYSIRLFYMLRELIMSLTGQCETQLPIIKQEQLVKENDALDLNCSDLIACTVSLNDRRERRFLVIDPVQFILVEPEVKRIGWGVVKFSELVQNVEVSNDKDDSRSLIISIRSNRWKSGNGYAPPHNEYVLNSLFTFDDHIRCMAAKQHLTKARDRARRMKLEKTVQLLDISSNNNTTNANKNMSTPILSSLPNDLLNYNLANSRNSLSMLNHPGRASLICQTWSQIAQSDRHATTVATTNSSSSSAPSPIASLQPFVVRQI